MVDPTTDRTNPPVTGESPGKKTTTDIPKRPHTVDFGPLTKHRLPWGVAGVFFWMLLFSIGVLVPAEPSRKYLGWKPESDVQTYSKKLEERIAELEKKAQGTKTNGRAAPEVAGSANLDQPKETVSSAAISPISPVSPDPKGQGTPVVSSSVSDPTDTSNSTGDPGPGKFRSFVVAAFTFTPLNVGMLCILAAFIGGCSINKNEILRIQQDILDLEADPPVPPNPDLTRLRQRLDYLTEHPGYSTIRGLVVYLIIISGLFIIGAPLTGENGTHSVTLEQYMKLAGLFSFFGYLSGYDPTVFSSVIGLGTKQLNTGKTGP